MELSTEGGESIAGKRSGGICVVLMGGTLVSSQGEEHWFHCLPQSLWFSFILVQILSRLNAGMTRMEPSHLAWLVSSGTTSLACALTCFDETQLRGILPEAETVHTHLTLDI